MCKVKLNVNQEHSIRSSGKSANIMISCFWKISSYFAKFQGNEISCFAKIAGFFKAKTYILELMVKVRNVSWCEQNEKCERV